MERTYQDKLDQLRCGTLDPSAFSHTDHIGVAFEAIRQYGCFDAISIVGQGIRKLTLDAGKPEKFHATLTVAFISVIAERMEQASYSDALEFIHSNSDLAEKTALTPWYSEARLGSNLARSILLMPDKVPEHI